MANEQQHKTKQRITQDKQQQHKATTTIRQQQQHKTTTVNVMYCMQEAFLFAKLQESFIIVFQINKQTMHPPSVCMNVHVL
jgi:heme/copper-type cytochrome/quinol oxidase subunit 3